MTDELVRPRDIIEEIELEFDSSAFIGPLTCSSCGHEMELVTSTKSLCEGKLVVEFEQYRCPLCRRERMTIEQAKRLEVVKRFLRQMEEERSPLSPSIAKIKPLNSLEFVVRMAS
jgi:transposase-like protein